MAWLLTAPVRICVGEHPCTVQRKDLAEPVARVARKPSVPGTAVRAGPHSLSHVKSGLGGGLSLVSVKPTPGNGCSAALGLRAGSPRNGFANGQASKLAHALVDKITGQYACFLEQRLKASEPPPVVAVGQVGDRVNSFDSVPKAINRVVADARALHGSRHRIDTGFPRLVKGRLAVLANDRAKALSTTHVMNSVHNIYYAAIGRQGQDLSEILHEQLERVLTRELPHVLELISLERLSGGASQETYKLKARAGKGELTLCLRRAPGGMLEDDDQQRPGLDVEAALMRAAGAVGVPEPRIHYVLREEDGLGEGFIMQWLEGETLGRRIVKAQELEQARSGLARQCGILLARIHAIDLASEALEDRLTRLTPREFVERTWERYTLLETPQPMIDYTARWLLEHLPQDPRMCLVHNDFRNGNLMVDGDGVCAVLDWETAHIGDPVRDLGWLCTRSWRFGGKPPVGGFGSRGELLDAYAQESGYQVSREHLKFWEVFGSFWWSVGCLGMANHYRIGPDRTVERPAIGRRTSECQADCVNLLIPGTFEAVEPVSPDLGLNMPESGELLESVRDFLRTEVMTQTEGRLRFLSLVASNSLAILMRESRLSKKHQFDEKRRLQTLLSGNESLQELRCALSRKLREGSISLDSTELTAHLRQTVMNQLLIDQPKYPALQGAEDA